MVLLERIQRITSKGQITLPAAWRKQMGATAIVVRTKGDMIEITPARLAKNIPREITVFDALRDNGGKGIKAKDLSKLLRKIDR
jgi:AbrB family looped-hinge helix DNA binding protein